MIRRTLFTMLLLCLLVGQAAANMASPEINGSKGAAPLVSRQLDVLSETLHIRAFGRLDSAEVHASYRISAPPGVHGSLPLLFVAMDIHDVLRVFYDGRPVALEALNTADFASFLDPEKGREEEVVVDFWGGNGGWVYGVKDLQAFTLDITPGEHTVDVYYTASPWIDRGDWIRETSIRYSLSPARHWKSFGPLEIVVDVPEADGLFRTTLKAPMDGSLPGRAVWRFTEIPADHIAIAFTPSVDASARLLMGLSPFGLALAVGALLLLLHIRWMHRFRVNGNRGRSMPLVIGALLAPLGFLIAFLFSYDLIDMAIGPDAGRFHGYTFMYLLLYPVIMPLYALGCSLLDRFWKRRYAGEVEEVSA
ncbi:MAG: hypothetical protein IT229_10050 [Flavobacteriales bacterium]|nr:hypothetical protein [Flavobacteriales bacterium]